MLFSINSAFFASLSMILYCVIQHQHLLVHFFIALCYSASTLYFAASAIFCVRCRMKLFFLAQEFCGNFPMTLAMETPLWSLFWWSWFYPNPPNKVCQSRVVLLQVLTTALPSTIMKKSFPGSPCLTTTAPSSIDTASKASATVSRSHLSRLSVKQKSTTFKITKKPHTYHAQLKVVACISHSTGCNHH